MSERIMKRELGEAKQTIISMGMLIADYEKALKKCGYMAERIAIMRDKHSLGATMQMSNGEPLYFERIMEIVSIYYNETKEDIRGTKRPRNLVDARHMFCYLSKQNTSSTLKEIGAYIGGKDHSTVLHAIDKITDLLQNNKLMQRDYNKIIQLIK
jgi:chromosomal replication initiation ATPase DnaA